MAIVPTDRNYTYNLMMENIRCSSKNLSFFRIRTGRFYKENIGYRKSLCSIGINYQLPCGTRKEEVGRMDIWENKKNE